MFYEDNGFRDMFIYGSIAMLAALTLPSQRAHAAEIYLCGDGRTVELAADTRSDALRTDACVTSWYNERQKTLAAKLGKPSSAVAQVAQTTAYQIQTSAIEPALDGDDVAADDAGSTRKRGALSKMALADARHAGKTGRTRAPASHTGRVARADRGLRYMGDGIYAQ